MNKQINREMGNQKQTNKTNAQINKYNLSFNENVRSGSPAEAHTIHY
jgi:hypothetical protein